MPYRAGLVMVQLAHGSDAATEQFDIVGRGLSGFGHNELKIPDVRFLYTTRLAGVAWLLY